MHAGGVLTGKYIDGKASKDSRLNYFEGTPCSELNWGDKDFRGFVGCRSASVFVCRLHGSLQQVAGKGSSGRVCQIGREARSHAHTIGNCMVQSKVTLIPL